MSAGLPENWPTLSFTLFDPSQPPESPVLLVASLENEIHPKKCSHPPRHVRELLGSEYNGIEFLLFFKLQCQYWKIIGGAGFVYCVSEGCGLDLGSWVGCGGCGFHLAHLWTLVFTKTTSEQCPRSHAGSIIRSKPSSPFLSPSSNTHRVPTTHTHTPPRLADTRTTRLSPLPQ